MTLKVFKSWIEKHPFVLDSIFGQSCLKEKGLQVKTMFTVLLCIIVDHNMYKLTQIETISYE